MFKQRVEAKCCGFFRLVLFLCLLISGCQTPPQKPSVESSDSQNTRNNCYSLLAQLLNDEKDVSKLRFIKREDAELKLLIKKISDAARTGAAQIESFAKSDASLKLDETQLPPGEAKTRQDIAAAKQKILLGESGPNFELDLLLTQIEALNYAAHLAKVAGDNDFQPERKRYLMQLSRQMQSLHDETEAQLTLRRPPGTK